MRNESIEKTFHSARFLVGDLQACLSDATAVEALILLPLIERAANLKSDISALYEARLQEAQPTEEQARPPSVVVHKPKAYKLLRDRVLQGGLVASAGTTVYDLHGHDYGLANDDARATGIEHTSVTLKSDGSYPYFTVPVRDLEALQ